MSFLSKAQVTYSLTSHLFAIAFPRVIAANYPGTTVEFAKGLMKFPNIEAEVIDAPGTYSLEPTSKAEEVATSLIDDADLIINVIDATMYGVNKKETLGDLALLTGATVINEDLGDDIDLIQPEQLGECIKTVSSEFETIFQVKENSKQIKE